MTQAPEAWITQTPPLLAELPSAESAGGRTPGGMPGARGVIRLAGWCMVSIPHRGEPVMTPDRVT